MKPKTQKLLVSTWDKFKRNGDNTNEVKLFSFENIIEISSLISTECTRIKCNEFLKYNNMEPSAWLAHGRFSRANKCNVFEEK